MIRADQLRILVHRHVTMVDGWAYLTIEGLPGTRRYALNLCDRRTHVPTTLFTGTSAALEAYVQEHAAELQERVNTYAAELQAAAQAAKEEDDALRIFLAEHLFGWYWIDGPKYDFDGDCEWHRLIVPPDFKWTSLTWPPRGVILPTYHLWSRWTTDRKQAHEVEAALIARNLGTSYVAALRALYPAGYDPDLWLLQAPPLDRCRAARKVLEREIQR